MFKKLFLIIILCYEISGSIQMVNGTQRFYGDHPLTCFTCYGLECNLPDILGEERNCKLNSVGCLTVFDLLTDEIIEKGCYETINGTTIDYCFNNNQQCFLCKSNYCNRATSVNDYITCLDCDSNYNVLCSQKPFHLNHNKYCYSNCITKLYTSTYSNDNNKKSILRGCLDDLSTEEQYLCKLDTETDCQICNNEKCNDKIIPEVRHQCYYCHQPPCDVNNEKNVESLPCYNYMTEEKCITFFNTKDMALNITYLGCLSDFNQLTIETCLADHTCLLCNSKNCNHPNFPPKPSEIFTKQCIHCDSVRDPVCSYNAGALPASKCSDDNVLCYTRVKDGRTWRGCLSELEHGMIQKCTYFPDNECTSCFGNVCNADIFPPSRESCYICNSTINSNCFELKDLKPKVCTKYDPDDYCFTALIDNKHVIRSCSSFNGYLCDNNQNTCTKCNSNYGIGCNNQTMYSSAGHIKVPLTTIIFCSIAFLFFLSWVTYVMYFRPSFTKPTDDYNENKVNDWTVF